MSHRHLHRLLVLLRLPLLLLPSPCKAPSPTWPLKQCPLGLATWRSYAGPSPGGAAATVLGGGLQYICYSVAPTVPGSVQAGVGGERGAVPALSGPLGGDTGPSGRESRDSPHSSGPCPLDTGLDLPQTRRALGLQGGAGGLKEAGPGVEQRERGLGGRREVAGVWGPTGAAGPG